MNRDIALIGITITIIMLSFLFDRRRTLKGVITGARMLYKLLPQFILLLIFVSTCLGVVPQETLAHLLGRQAGGPGVMIAALIGSVALIPGPIAYPLAAMLAEQGVSYTVLAVFVTSLMMVGVLTLPVEKEYLGTRIAIVRNLLSLIGAVFVGLIVGMII
ncbi:MAG: hypothetical protein JSV78_11705 [Phycisphaerales bacterium]|nr:MAG: hypothetical protein JSV78_11705 [Phycisphaerales bacterium]